MNTKETTIDQITAEINGVTLAGISKCESAECEVVNQDDNAALAEAKVRQVSELINEIHRLNPRITMFVAIDTPKTFAGSLIGNVLSVSKAIAYTFGSADCADGTGEAVLSIALDVIRYARKQNERHGKDGDTREITPAN